MLMHRYIGRTLFTLTAFVAVTLTAVIWLTQSMKLLDLVANSDAPPALFLKLVLLSLPKFLEVVLPLSLVISTVFVYNKMAAENELVVLRAAGVDHLRLARPAVFVAAFLTALLLIFSGYISPKSRAAMTVLRHTVKAQYSAFLLREGVFNTFGSDLTVYMRSRGADGTLYGLLIHDARNKSRPPQTITAKRGEVISGNGGPPMIVVYDGTQQQMDARTQTINRLAFREYTVEIKGLETNVGPLWRDPDERTLGELIRPDFSDSRDRARRAEFLAEISDRLVTPFNAISFTFLALTALLPGPFNRRGQGSRIGIAAILIMFAQAGNLAAVSLMKKYMFLTPLLYILTFVPLMLCPWFLTMEGEKFLGRLFWPRPKGFNEGEEGA